MQYGCSLKLRQNVARNLFLLAVAGVLTYSSSGLHAEQVIPAGVVVQSVSVWPEQIELHHPWDVAQLLVTGHLDSDQQIDLTELANLQNTSTLVHVSSTGQVSPLADGKDVLIFQVQGHHVQLPVIVSGMGDPAVVSFVQDVAPSLSRMGCNSGTCHGAKDGQRGFKLSLRGYDYLYDHSALTDDIGARRFNRANPDQSLMLLKASGSIPHVGGALTRPGDRHYELLRRWITQGAVLDLDAPRVQSIDLLPRNPILPRAQLRQQMVVLAHYSDGTVRDVTADAFVESGNIEILSADKQGSVQALRRGEAPVLARYEGAYAATTITVMGDRTGFVWNNPSANNYIDELVFEKLQRVKILPSDLCTDAEFVRRLYLDLTGLLPTSTDVREFLADPRPADVKRNELIDRLVGSPDYVEHWTNKWADMLQVNRKFLGELGATALRSWIQEAVTTNMPYNEFAYRILTASGSNLENPAASYWKVLREPAAAMENTTHLFLAVRFNCNKCHDHPFERWTQDQYYQMTAFFAQVGRKQDPDFSDQNIPGSAVMAAQPLVEIIYDTESGETTHDRTGQVTAPQVPFGEIEPSQLTASRRDQLAEWITSPDNPYFASSYVNRLWGYLLGVGLIEPIDDIRACNPPTNPRLLAALTDDFVSSGFDIQHMIRTICRSRTYQQSISTNRWNEDDTINYSHAMPRRLSAEVLYDAIYQATGARSHISGLPDGLRAAQLPDSGVSSPFLDDFGRPPRESVCECERTDGVVLGPIMKLVNGPTVNNALIDPDNELTQLVASQADDQQLIEEVFLRFLARYPTEAERKLGIASLEAARQDEQLAREQLERYQQQLSEGFAAWEAELPRPATWHSIRDIEITSLAGAHFVQGSDGVVTASGPLAKDVYQIMGTVPLTRLTGLRLEALPDSGLPAGGPGRADNGNFVINEFELYRIDAGAAEEAALEQVALRHAAADFSQTGWDISGAVDGDERTGWAVSPEFNRVHTATFEIADPLVSPQPLRIVVKLRQSFQDGRHNLGKFRLWATDANPPLTDEGNLPANIAKICAVPPSERSLAQRKQLRDYYFDQDPEYQRLQAALALATEQAQQHKLTGVQDLAWALINTPAFLFNR